MRYNVSQLLLSPTGTSSKFQIESDSKIEDILVLGGLAVSMYKMHEGIWVDILGQGKMEATCSRCVNEFEYLVDIQGEQQYISVLDIGPNQGLDVFLIDDRHELDVQELVRQSAIVGDNVKKLCSDSCRGICAQCGTRLNDSVCECVERTTDPRWDALIELTKGEI